MKKSRVLWGLWLLMSVIFCMATDSMAGYLLVLLSVIVPLLAALPVRRAAKRLETELTISAYGEKGTAFAGKILLTNKSLFPTDRILCRVSCENLLTGEKEVISIHMAAPSRSNTDTEFLLKSRHAGKVRLSLQKMICYDSFGLFPVKTVPSREISAFALVVPESFSLETQIAYGESTNMDSDEYSMKKAGYDPSETFAIREYQPGDRIRQIHWKLTEKFDNLMVRDYGLPIQNTILLLLETGYGTEEADADCLDALAEALYSVSQELLSQQIIHSIGWQNHEENTFPCVEVETEEDLNALLPELLGAVPGRDGMSVADHYMESREQLEFAHMVIFSQAHQASLGGLASQCILTEVICSGEAAGYDQQDGIAILGGTPENLPETLSYLEI